ncbi:purple acid phosphatase 17-like isoform X1 [Nicotiana tabacum]|uniref:Purple acid phosphatase n=1 Tax=Nicotiana tabacum TaxID=4097 RepID=A0A1S3XK00_TOBAC|nr:PREDICTED: purple acid phosphatase 17-like isoform X1 [Nicotiana tabacum]
MVKFSKNSMVLCFWLVIVFVISCTNAVRLKKFDHPTKGDGTLNFLVLGDWGRKGTFNQSHVAHKMGRIGEELNIDFVVSTGDNFYDNGLTGVHDPNFVESFTNIYTAKSLQKQWYSVLGNHDYRGNVEAQLSPCLRKIDRRWLCLRSFIVNAEIAEIFMVDTTPFVQDYFTNPKDHTYDWRGVIPPHTYTANILKDIEKALSESTARWKIVVGHHAIRSVGHHGDTQVLVDRLLPMLRAYNVDFYMNGHDHCLEHISDTESPIQFLTSGAGSKAWRGDVKGLNRADVNFFHDGQGFMSVQLTPTEAEIKYYDVFGRVLHRWNRSKLLHSAI